MGRVKDSCKSAVDREAKFRVIYCQADLIEGVGRVVTLIAIIK